MTVIDRPQYSKSCHFQRPPRFTGFNPWTALYGPHGGLCYNQCPRTAAGCKQQEATNKTTDDNNQFVLSADERECVQNIGGAVANFLKPYGINVNVGVAHVPKDGEF